ncbi:MAG: DNA repair protein RecO [Pseudomonadota bacterium]
MRVTDQACWILHRRPWRESSLLLEVFSRDHGRIGLVGRGARGPRSPSRGLTEPFILLQCSWSRRGELGTLTGLEASGGRVPLQGQALWCGLYVNELILTLFERDDPSPELFDHYSACLPRLSNKDDQLIALRQIELSILATLGVLPDLSATADGDESVLPNRLYHVVPEAGLVPVSQRGSDVVAGRAALLLAGELTGDFDAQARRDARILTRRLIEHQLAGRTLKTRELFRQGPVRGPQ